MLIIWFNFYKESSLNLNNVSGKEKREETRKTVGKSAKFGKGTAHSDRKKERKRIYIQEKNVRHDKMTLGI